MIKRTFGKIFNLIKYDGKASPEELRDRKLAHELQIKKKQEFIVQQAEKAKAEAEAESQRLLRLATSKEVVSLKWIEKWDGKLPEIMSGKDGAALLINPGK